MLGTLINKELRGIIYSPKFSATFAICSLLLLLSVYSGIREYRGAVDQYDASVTLSEQRMQEATSWGQLTSKAIRKPDPMQIFVSGLSYDIGRFSNIYTDKGVKLQNSPYSDDPIFAVFRILDFSFIVQIVISLFAILFTYDAINGEREQGTLRLVLSNPVPRAKYLIAKATGSWLGLAAPLSVTVLLCLLMVILFRVPFESSHWIRLIGLLGLSLLYFTFFVFLGVFLSTLTRHSSVSFLVALVCWIAFVMITPRAGVMAASQIVSVPRVAEIEGQRAAFAKDRWSAFYGESEDRWGNSSIELEGKTEDERDMALWARMQVEDSLRRIVELEIEKYDAQLHLDLRRHREQQQSLAFALTRFSPASTFQLGAMTLAGTDLSMKTSYEDAMNRYRTEFIEYTEAKQRETGDVGGMMITMSSETGFSFGGSRETSGLDLTDVPRFLQPEKSVAEYFTPVIFDFGLLLFGIIAAFAGSFVSFLRFDVR